jgi:Carboxypeptidase regulatory-like domain
LRDHRHRQLDHFSGGIVIQLSLKYFAKVSCAQFVAITVALILAGFAAGAQAQSIQGSVLGVVKDTSGAVVPGAAVTLQNLDDGTIRKAVSSGTGDYQFLDSPAGRYSVDITAAGFERWSTSGLVLAARQELRVDAALVVGNIQQQIVVSADAISTINTDTASISSTYSSTEVQNLPVNTRASASGTSALNIIGTLPGVQEDHGNFSLQGALPFQTEVTVDGITVQSAAGNNPIADAFPSSESISEVRTDGAMNAAEFSQPGEVTVTTKAGTNTIHGSAFWYYQTAGFDAIPYTYPITTSKPKLVANTFGGSFGGPVVIPHLYNGHNKTFIFGAYEGWRHPASSTYQYIVPSTLMKQGNFSKYNVLNPVSGQYGPISGLTDPFTGGSYGTQLPAINSAAQKLLSFYPDPNIGDPTTYTDNGVANYQVNKDSSGTSNQFDIRGDQYFGSNQKFLLWGRFTWKNYPINQPEPLSVPSTQNTNQNRVLKISANYTFSPRIINEFSFGYVQNTTGQSSSFNGLAFTQSLGLQGLQNLYFNGIPELDFFHISSLNADRLSSLNKANTYVYADSLSWSKGNHQMKFGTEIETLQAVTPLGFVGANNYGTFQYNTTGSAGLFTGVDFADFLSGLPYNTFYDVVSQDNDGKSAHYDFYGQDQWKLSDNLSLTFGLRYELHPGYYDVHGDTGNFDPSYPLSGASIYPTGFANILATDFLASANACTPYGTRSGGAVINGAPCMPVLSNSQSGYPNGLKHYPKKRFMPRFGFAYKPFNSDKTAVRGGFALYNINMLGNAFYSLTGTLQAATTQYFNSLTNGVPAYQWPQIYGGVGNGGGTTNYGQDYFGTANSTNWKDPYTEQWSLSVDHELAAGYTMRASYVGAEMHQLVWAPDENTLPFSSTVSAANQPLSARLFPNWGRINTRATGANESYHSAQVEFNHRFEKGLQLNSTYTFAKALADNQGPANVGFAGDTGGSRATSILDRYADFGNVYGTRRNQWNTTMVYDLPIGRGKKFAGSMPRIADLVVGGWRLSNIFVWQSGPFESPYFDSGQGDPSGTGSGLNSTNTGFDPGHRSQYPDTVPGASIKPSGRTRLTYLNPGALTCPGYPGYTPGTPCTTGSGAGPYPNPIGRFGDARVGSIVGPGFVNLSSGLSKVFPVTERVHVRLEATFNDVLNHTNLGDPNMDISSPAFGQITGTIEGGSNAPTIGSAYGGARSGQVAARIDF